MNTIVNFEIAKLLKENGFEQNRFNTPWYNGLGSFRGRTDINKDGKTFSEVYPNEPSFYGCPIKEEHKKEFTIQSYSAPTIGDAIMWLYEKHGIWIEVFKYKDHAADCNDDYRFKNNYDSITYKTPTEAYSSAILYTLNNLI